MIKVNDLETAADDDDIFGLDFFLIFMLSCFGLYELQRQKLGVKWIESEGKVGFREGK